MQGTGSPCQVKLTGHTWCQMAWACDTDWSHERHSADPPLTWHVVLGCTVLSAQEHSYTTKDITPTTLSYTDIPGQPSTVENHSKKPPRSPRNDYSEANHSGTPIRSSATPLQFGTVHHTAYGSRRGEGPLGTQHCNTSLYSLFAPRPCAYKGGGGQLF
jgi:hypothetical protein